MILSSHSWSGFRPAMSSGNVMFSSAVRVGTRLNDWKMKPTRSRRSRVRSASLRLVKLVSPMETVPEVASSSPAQTCIRVDLPEPLGPMMAVNRPLAKVTETPSRARTSASPAP